MRRRELLHLATALGAGLASLPARAAIQCGPFMPPAGVQMCEAGVLSTVANQTAAAVNGQHMSQWCWAACIAMVFEYHGHPVVQERIVADTFGRLMNLPGQPHQILAKLNRVWEDDHGDRFRVQGDAFTANAITAAHDLANDQPLIIGTMGHAVLLTSLTYVRDMVGRGEVQQAVVRDPWPGRGRRMLTPQEWFGISFAVRIRVS